MSSLYPQVLCTVLSSSIFCIACTEKMKGYQRCTDKCSLKIFHYVVRVLMVKSEVSHIFIELLKEMKRYSLIT